MVYTYLITGANKGIGFALVGQLVKKDDVKVIATARSPAKATELKKLAESTKKVEIIELDVSSKASVEALGPQLEKIAPEGIDFFVGNAGIASVVKRAIDIPYEGYLDVLNTNLFGNLFVFKTVYPFLLKKETRKVAFISSIAGSLSQFVPVPQTPYGISKVALNYLTKSLALDHGPEGFTFVSINPGFVPTEGSDEFMKSSSPQRLALIKSLSLVPISPKESADYLIKIYDSITTTDSGKFLNYDGTEFPL